MEKMTDGLKDWTQHALSVDSIKDTFLAQVEKQVQALCEVLRKGGLPVPASLAVDVAETLGSLLDKACHGKLSAGKSSFSRANLSFGTLISVANEFRAMTPQEITQRVRDYSGNFLAGFIEDSLKNNSNSMVKALLAFGFLRRIKERAEHSHASLTRALLAQRQIKSHHIQTIKGLLTIVERFKEKNITISQDLLVQPENRRFHFTGDENDMVNDQPEDAATGPVGDEFEEWWFKMKFLKAKSLYSQPGMRKNLYEIALSLGLQVPADHDKWEDDQFDNVGKEIIFAIQFHQSRIPRESQPIRTS
eukprot:815477-Rhodomonas_salina.2